MYDPTHIYPLLGNVLLPFAALLCEELTGTRIMLTVLANPGTSLDTSLLGGSSFFNFHSGQMVGEEDGLEPVSVMTFFHETTGIQMTLLMTYAASEDDANRFSIAIQVKDPLLGEELEHALNNVLRDSKFESILMERHPTLTGDYPMNDYELVLEKYRTAIQGRTVKLYLRQSPVLTPLQTTATANVIN